MARIIKYELADALSSLGPITLLDPASLATSLDEDLFLCALGFEPRCLTLPKQLKDAGYKVRRSVYFKYGTNLDDNAINLPGLEAHLRDISLNIHTIEADVPDFSTRLREHLDLVMSESKSNQPSVTLDISVTANRLLLRCMKVLLEYDIRARIIYSEAAVYHPTQSEYDSNPELWKQDNALGLERGVSDVMPSIDHPGQALDPLPDALILFPSFKAERSKAVISFVDPSLLRNPNKKVVWLLGCPHLNDDKWRLAAMRQINEISPEARQFEISTFDYRETLRVLENLYGELAEHYRITLSPLGSKMQALGTAFFCHMHPDVRIVLSTPKEYNAVQYSEGCKAKWKIELGSLIKVRHELEQIGSLRIDD